MEPTQSIKELGFWLAALCAVAWFVKRDLWPFCMRQIEQRYADSQERHNRMLGLLEKLTDQVTTQRRQSIEALHALASQMTELAATVANVAHVVSDIAARVEHHHPSERHK